MTPEELAAAFRRFGDECLDRWYDLPYGKDAQLKAVADAAHATARHLENPDDYDDEE